MTINNSHEKYINFLKSTHIKDIDKGEISKKNQEYLELFAQNQKSVAIIFDQSVGQILYITDNIEALSGFSVESILKEGLSLLFQRFTSEHQTFPIESFMWASENIKPFPQEVSKIDRKYFFCGVQLTKKDNEIVRVLFRYIPLEFDNNNLTTLFLISMTNINYLMKGDNYWARMTFGSEGKHKFHYFSHQKLNVKGDILTNREKAILRLIAEGYESKEIAEKCFISFYTVNNHRKNMLLKTGAKDTTALVQLCKMCDII